ncbi:hypothetical protein E2C01_070481 [Portunus trituberculatus]|uniref:Uncharacterized protein n=1 Tax=Portunus trituberculatus TaxID=210409 RepID=A0A5B7I5D6_PORTR|nr:hypothetical protein [Portunus trituberculatus]
MRRSMGVARGKRKKATHQAQLPSIPPHTTYQTLPLNAACLHPSTHTTCPYLLFHAAYLRHSTEPAPFFSTVPPPNLSPLHPFRSSQPPSLNKASLSPRSVHNSPCRLPTLCPSQCPSSPPHTPPLSTHHATEQVLRVVTSAQLVTDHHPLT